MADKRIENRGVRWDDPGAGIRGQAQSPDSRNGHDATLVAGQYEPDNGLRTALLLSLFCDALADDDDELPEEQGGETFPDRRGYWADALSRLGPDDRWGSRLWLLKGETLTSETRTRARRYALEACRWVETMGLGRIAVETELFAERRGWLVIEVTVTDATKGDIRSFRFLWDSMIREGV